MLKLLQTHDARCCKASQAAEEAAWILNTQNGDGPVAQMEVGRWRERVKQGIFYCALLQGVSSSEGGRMDFERTRWRQLDGADGGGLMEVRKNGTRAGQRAKRGQAGCAAHWTGVVLWLRLTEN